jgi:hypothetical protein
VGSEVLLKFCVMWFCIQGGVGEVNRGAKVALSEMNRRLVQGFKFSLIEDSEESEEIRGSGMTVCLTG